MDHHDFDVISDVHKNNLGGLQRRNFILSGGDSWTSFLKVENSGNTSDFMMAGRNELKEKLNKLQ